MMFQVVSSLLLLSLFSVGQGNSQTLLSVTNGGHWGEWGPLEMCRVGSSARGFSLKLVETHGDGDDTALTAIRLYCVMDIDDQNEYLIQSTEGRLGTWTSPLWCLHGNLNAFSLKVDHRLGRGDKSNIATANIRFMCSDKRNNLSILPTVGSNEVLSPTCRYGICGIRTKVGPPNGYGKDLLLSDVVFTCCANSLLSSQLPNEGLPVGQHSTGKVLGGKS
ncbi:vitelline membrane outer layer protein 1 homolog [Ascaphus truei]|uniref:vitelline membrane outer layer protein 1 homolog n=1 Tax=Ascaphus truei TaxID=8439 RepID=UPI003F596598